MIKLFPKFRKNLIVVNRLLSFKPLSQFSNVDFNTRLELPKLELNHTQTKNDFNNSFLSVLNDGDFQSSLMTADKIKFLLEENKYKEAISCIEEIPQKEITKKILKYSIAALSKSSFPVFQTHFNFLKNMNVLDEIEVEDYNIILQRFAQKMSKDFILELINTLKENQKLENLSSKFLKTWFESNPGSQNILFLVKIAEIWKPLNHARIQIDLSSISRDYEQQPLTLLKVLSNLENKGFRFEDEEGKLFELIIPLLKHQGTFFDVIKILFSTNGENFELKLRKLFLDPSINPKNFRGDLIHLLNKFPIDELNSRNQSLLKIFCEKSDVMDLLWKKCHLLREFPIETIMQLIVQNDHIAEFSNSIKKLESHILKEELFLNFSNPRILKAKILANIRDDRLQEASQAFENEYLRHLKVKNMKKRMKVFLSMKARHLHSIGAINYSLKYLEAFIDQHLDTLDNLDYLIAFDKNHREDLSLPSKWRTTSKNISYKLWEMGHSDILFKKDSHPDAAFHCKYDRMLKIMFEIIEDFDTRIKVISNLKPNTENQINRNIEHCRQEFKDFINDLNQNNKEFKEFFEFLFDKYELTGIFNKQIKEAHEKLAFYKMYGVDPEISKHPDEDYRLRMNVNYEEIFPQTKRDLLSEPKFQEIVKQVCLESVEHVPEATEHLDKIWEDYKIILEDRKKLGIKVGPFKNRNSFQPRKFNKTSSGKKVEDNEKMEEKPFEKLTPQEKLRLKYKNEMKKLFKDSVTSLQIKDENLLRDMTKFGKEEEMEMLAKASGILQIQKEIDLRDRKFREEKLGKLRETEGVTGPNYQIYMELMNEKYQTKYEMLEKDTERIIERMNYGIPRESEKQKLNLNESNSENSKVIDASEYSKETPNERKLLIEHFLNKEQRDQEIEKDFPKKTLKKLFKKSKNRQVIDGYLDDSNKNLLLNLEEEHHKNPDLFPDISDDEKLFNTASIQKPEYDESKGIDYDAFEEDVSFQEQTYWFKKYQAEETDSIDNDYLEEKLLKKKSKKNRKPRRYRTESDDLNDDFLEIKPEMTLEEKAEREINGVADFAQTHSPMHVDDVWRENVGNPDMNRYLDAFLHRELDLPIDYVGFPYHEKLAQIIRSLKTKEKGDAKIKGIQDSIKSKWTPINEDIEEPEKIVSQVGEIDLPENLGNIYLEANIKHSSARNGETFDIDNYLVTNQDEVAKCYAEPNWSQTYLQANPFKMPDISDDEQMSLPEEFLKPNMNYLASEKFYSSSNQRLTHFFHLKFANEFRRGVKILSRDEKEAFRIIQKLISEEDPEEFLLACEFIDWGIKFSEPLAVKMGERLAEILGMKFSLEFSQRINTFYRELDEKGKWKLREASKVILPANREVIFEAFESHSISVCDPKVDFYARALCEKALTRQTGLKLLFNNAKIKMANGFVDPIVLQREKMYHSLKTQI